MGKHYEWRIESTARGLRVDQFLADALSQSEPGLSRARLQSYIRQGCLVANGGLLGKSGYKLRAGDRLILEIPETPTSELIPEEAQLSILYQDDEIVVLNKAPQLCVHAGAGNSHGTLVERVLGQGILLSSLGLPLRPGVVHRLDKGTSGVIVMAKTDRAHLGIAAQFAERGVEKLYLAVVLGHLPLLSGTIENRLGRHPKHRQRFASRARGGKEAVSRFRVLGIRGPASLIEVRPETGRTHQIRVHLSEYGYPILGDAAYGASRKRLIGMRWEEGQKKIIEQLDHPLLHAYRLSFRHPLSHEWMSFAADPPQEFMALIDSSWLPRVKQDLEGEFTSLPLG